MSCKRQLNSVRVALADGTYLVAKWTWGVVRPRIVAQQAAKTEPKDEPKSEHE